VREERSLRRLQASPGALHAQPAAADDGVGMESIDKKRLHPRLAPTGVASAAEADDEDESHPAGGGVRRHRHADGGADGAEHEAAAVCVNNEEGFLKLSNGHFCDEAASHCESGMGNKIVRRLCPKTCGLCDDQSAISGSSSNSSTSMEDLVLGGKVYENDVLLRELVPGGCNLDQPGNHVSGLCSSGHGCVIRAHRFVVSADLNQDMEQSFYVWEEMTSIFEQ
jgi:hypothetical protein